MCLKLVTSLIQFWNSTHRDCPTLSMIGSIPTKGQKNVFCSFKKKKKSVQPKIRVLEHIIQIIKFNSS